MQETIPKLLNTVFQFLDILRESSIDETEVTLDFGEYANPSFESQVETIGKAKTQGIMSNEAAVDELYGDTKDEDWKKEEIERLNARDGIEMLEEPRLNMEGLEVEDESKGRQESIFNAEKAVPGTAGSGERAGG